MPSCSVKQCSYKANEKNRQRTVHRFPKKDALRRKWCDIIGIENLKPHKVLHLCSLHFEESSFNRTLQILKLRDDAVPSVSFLNNEDRINSKDEGVNDTFQGSSASAEVTDKQKKNEISQRLHLQLETPISTKGTPAPQLQPTYSWQRSSEYIQGDSDSSETRNTSPTPTLDMQVQSADLPFQCNKCRQGIEGFRYVCVQCPDYDLCAACEARGLHHTHYVLRVPGPRPQEEVQKILRNIRCFLEELNSEVEIKIEIKEEYPFEDDPIVLNEDLRPQEFERTHIDIEEHIKMTKVSRTVPVTQDTLSTKLPYPPDIRSITNVTRPNMNSTRPTMNITRPTMNITRPTMSTIRPTQTMNTIRPTMNVISPTTNITRPTTNITRPTMNSTRPTMNISTQTMNTTRPTMNDISPTTNITRPTMNSTRPTMNISTPTMNTTRPTMNVVRPTTKITRPTMNISTPSMNITRPTMNVIRPTTKITRPIKNITRTTKNISRPTMNITRPPLKVDRVTSESSDARIPPVIRTEGQEPIKKVFQESQVTPQYNKKYYNVAGTSNQVSSDSNFKSDEITKTVKPASRLVMEIDSGILNLPKFIDPSAPELAKLL